MNLSKLTLAELIELSKQVYEEILIRIMEMLE